MLYMLHGPDCQGLCKHLLASMTLIKYENLYRKSIGLWQVANKIANTPALVAFPLRLPSPGLSSVGVQWQCAQIQPAVNGNILAS